MMINGLGGDDLLDGWVGNDSSRRAGNDTMLGDADNDTLNGGPAPTRSMAALAPTRAQRARQ